LSTRRARVHERATDLVEALLVLRERQRVGERDRRCERGERERQDESAR
jgi:hypothetical protein